MKRKCLLLFLIIMIILTGCATKTQSTAVETNGTAVKAAVKVAKPQDAVDAIYASLSAYKAVSLRYFDLEESLEIDAAGVTEYYGKISDQNEGLADVIILLPKEQERESIRLALGKYKEKRMASFENYDILDAYSISQNAVIYEQGGYLILLMLLDNDAARQIIDEYIPL